MTKKVSTISIDSIYLNNESETTEDLEDSGQTEHNSGSSERKQHLTASDRLKGESVSRACGIVITHTHVILLYPGNTSLHVCKTSESQNILFLWIISVLALVLALKDYLFYMKKCFNWIPMWGLIWWGKGHLISDIIAGEQLGRHRNLSMNEEDLIETGAADEGDFRPRSRSAPPALWAAKKYGQQLRRMSDEFDILLDKGVRKQLFRY